MDKLTPSSMQKLFEVGFRILPGMWLYDSLLQGHRGRRTPSACLPVLSIRPGTGNLKGKGLSYHSGEHGGKASSTVCSKLQSFNIGSVDKCLLLVLIPLITLAGSFHGLLRSLSPDFNMHVHTCERPWLILLLVIRQGRPKSSVSFL